MTAAAGACVYRSAPWPGKPWPDTAWGKLDGLVWPREKHGAITGAIYPVQSASRTNAPGCAMFASASFAASQPERQPGRSALSAIQPLAGGQTVYSGAPWPASVWPQEPWGKITDFTREHSAFYAKISAEGA